MDQRWLETVRVRAASGSALDRLDAALAVGGELEADADALVRHFVDEARSAGHSWTAIGERLGVSKQAARQRFVEPVRHPPRSTPRLVRCLEAAQRVASAAGSSEVGTEHVLLGLFHEGLAANTLEKLGVTADGVGTAVRRLFPAPAGANDSRGSTQSDETSRCLAEAAAMAKRGGCDYVGTEHVLLAIALDPGSRGRRVLQDVGADIAAIKRELACFVEPSRARRRRRKDRKWEGGRLCSFCGKRPDDGVRLVAGPGVFICNDCVRLAEEVLTGRGGSQSSD